MGKAGLELKKEILLALGKTPIIKDQKLAIEPNKWFAEIENDYPALEKKYLRLEPTKTPMNNRQESGSRIKTFANPEGKPAASDGACFWNYFTEFNPQIQEAKSDLTNWPAAGGGG